jgi:hypothetical protein
MDSDKRIVKNMVLVYHDANKARKHIDVHIGRFSLIVRVSGKPVENKIKYNNNGELTIESKEALLNHVRKEIANHSRMPQNLDHSMSNAHCSWTANEPGIVGYGSGLTRQVFHESKVEILTAKRGHLKLYAPQLNSHNLLFVHELYPGDGKTAPIVVWGEYISDIPTFHDRLHLKLIQANELSVFKKKTDITTTTRKYDGASCYLVADKMGIHVFSPRISKETNRRIEYTGKLPELITAKTNHKYIGMGELLFKKRILGITGPYLSAAEVGGILNSDKIRPSNIIPEIRLYRIDKVDRLDTHGLPFWENRRLQYDLSMSHPILRVVSLCLPFHYPFQEGLVAVPVGGSVIDGFKIKFKGDETDMIIKSIDFFISDKQHIAGTMTCTYNDKEYKFGPSQLGNIDRCLEFMDNSNKLIGKTVKTVGFKGHIGRAARIIDIHLDK